MYRELYSLRQVLQQELKDTLPPLPGVEPEQLLDTYLNQLTGYVGVDVADRTVALLAINANQDELAHLLDVPNAPSGFAADQVADFFPGRNPAAPSTRPMTSAPRPVKSSALPPPEAAGIS